MAATPTELADRFLELLRERTATHDADEVRERFVAAYQQIEAAFADAPARDEILAKLASFLTPDLPDWEFACTANTCGIAVEAGADPAAAAGPLLDRLPALLAHAPAAAAAFQATFDTPNLEGVPEEQWEPAAKSSPEVAEHIRQFLGIGFAARAAMTMLCRSVPLRRQARTRGDLWQAAVAGREVNPYAFFLTEILAATDDEQVVVLDVAREAGFLVRVTGVRNNFHFYTLLQHALMSRPEYAGAGPTPSPLLAEIARGERMVGTVNRDEWAASGVLNADGEPYDRNLWSFYQWPALQPDGTIETAALAEPAQPWWAWGEMRPADLADLDGMKLLLLGPAEMPRAWGLGFFSPLHPALRSSVTIEKVLSPESVRGWLADIRAVPRQEVEEVRAEAMAARAAG